MKRILVVAVIIVMALGFSVQAHANLTLLGQGTSTHGTYNLIYDTDLDITWYDYTNVQTDWQNQMDWAGALTVDIGGNVYDDWRLPISFTPIMGCFGGGCTNSEMGHLYYTELGNVEIKWPSAYNGFQNTGDFQEVQSLVYWSGTNPYVDNNNYRTYFSFGDGDQHTSDKNNEWYAVAVMDGMAVAPPVVPEPISSTLFIIGGATLGFRRFRKVKIEA